MLSPHEFSTLLLIKDSPDRVDLGHPGLDALMERQLVELEQLTSGRRRPCITIHGYSFLKAAARIR
jgi:hypothetical protein